MAYNRPAMKGIVMAFSHVLSTIKAEEIQVGDVIPSQIDNNLGYEVISLDLKRHDIHLDCVQFGSDPTPTNQFKITWLRDSEKEIYTSVN